MARAPLSPLFQEDQKIGVWERNEGGEASEQEEERRPLTGDGF